jgi:LysM repeat protein
MRVWWRLHKVENGETLLSVARKYRTTAHEISEANQLDASADLEPGAKLIIPIPPGRRAPGDTLTYAKRLTVYRVRKGDTAATVANKLGIPVTVIRRWNHLRGDSLRGRRVLYVHLPVSPGSPTPKRTVVVGNPKSNKRLAKVETPEGTNTRSHTVRRGDTLYSIANRYNTTIKAIRRTNADLDIGVLRPGMVLIIPPK